MARQATQTATARVEAETEIRGDRADRNSPDTIDIGPVADRRPLRAQRPSPIRTLDGHASAVQPWHAISRDGNGRSGAVRWLIMPLPLSYGLVPTAAPPLKLRYNAVRAVPLRRQ